MLLHNQYEFDPNNDLIGSGGFARVYKAFDINLQRVVALKRFDKKDTKYSVLNEIRRCFDFSHPNIIRYLNCFEVIGTDSFGVKEVTEFGVMEYADTGDFTQLIDKKIKISTDELKEIVLGILEGLDYLHTPNAMHQKAVTIHRDLKASNILFSKINGKLIPKICDFGISKEIDNFGTITATATSTGFLGTIEYMSPEQINIEKFGKDKKLQPNADLWALGCMLYEYFTGKAPFGKRSNGDMQIDIQNKILDKEPNYPNSIPEPYLKIIQLCLVKNATDRVQDAKTLIQILLGEPEVPKVINEGGKEGIDSGDENNGNGGGTIVNPPDDNNHIWKILLKFIVIFPIIFWVIIIYQKDKTINSFNTDEEVATEEVATEEVVLTEELTTEFTNSANETFSYKGEKKHDDKTPDGKGTAEYSNGDKYEGEFQYGLRHGIGTYYWKDGERFEGAYKNNSRNGYGIYYDAKGNILEQGYYVNGVHR